MQTPDVNVLVDAFREDSSRHDLVRPWLATRARADEPLAVFELVLSGFVRVVTHPRVFDPPTPVTAALEFATNILAQPAVAVLRPGPRHRRIFVELCAATEARGNDVPDAYIAALATEHGCELVTADRGFARFPGLRCRPPG